MLCWLYMRMIHIMKMIRGIRFTSMRVIWSKRIENMNMQI